MRAAPIAAELQGLGFRQFGGLLEWTALRQAPPTGSMPGCFVVPEGLTSADSQLAGAVDQSQRNDVMVVLLLDAAMRRTDGLDDRLDELARGVRDRLVGWTHPDATGPMLHAGARLLSVSDGLVAWAERFRLPSRLRKDLR